MMRTLSLLKFPFSKTLFGFLLVFNLAIVSLQAQILQPMKWKFSTRQISDTEAELIFKVSLDKGWHIFSQFTPTNSPTGLSSTPMEFAFEKNNCYTRIGKVKEPPAHESYNDVFEVKELTFENEATLTQRILLKCQDAVVTGRISGQVCEQVCIPFDTSFEFHFSGTGKAAVVTTEPLPDTTAKAPTITVTSQVDTNIAAPTSALATTLEDGCGLNPGEKNTMDHSLLAIFIAGMLGGFLALLTPCVFPMIPLTVSFFTKRSGTRKKGIMNALIYAGSIIVIYVLLGFFVTVTLGSDALNDLASNGFFNMAFFIIFIIFAISFFGAFEITLPSSIINKADAASDRGGLIGIFFMAFTLSLVSFSCTGPIIGTLLVEAAHGRSYMGPITGMCGFAFALALPFALFAAFPSWLKTLPKSGGWLNTVKVSLGFLELALALKFLSNVDLAYHWGFLKREIFVALWVIIFMMWGMYLIGKLKFHHDSEIQHISIGRLLMSLLVFTFALYLAPGIWGAPLKLISGFPPPEFYKEWKTTDTECPHDLTCFHDYEEGMKYARAQGKPVIIDFTGWSCVNCRKMEDNVWSDPKVLKRLANDYILISLYVDDKENLPSELQYVSETTGKKIKTTGNKWSDLQATVYQTNSQPYYVLVDNRGKLLAEPRGYTPAVKDYLSFLEEGLCRDTKRKAIAQY